MNDPMSWSEAFAALKTFTASHDDIRVKPQSLRIPKTYREEFYALTDNAALALSGDLAGERLAEIASLAEMLAEVRGRICSCSNLRAYRLPASLENLIVSPEKAVSQPLFSLMLDALQNSLSREEVQDRAAQLISPAINDLQRCAYEAWAYLGILEAWKPVRFYGIVTADFAKLTVTETDEVTMGYQYTSPDKRLPETVFETADGKTIAVKTEVGLELDYYGEKVSRDRGYSSGGNTVDELAHRVLLAYRFPSPQELGLIADAEKNFVRPADLMCSFLLPREMENEYLFSSFVRHLRMVRSLRPGQILRFDQRGSFPDGADHAPLIPKWERTAVGYDEGLLREIASKLNT